MTVADFLKNLYIILERPAMYYIQRVEDINIIIFGETFFHKDSEMQDWNVQFNEFVNKEFDNTPNDYHWSKLIRLHSGSDAHSLELFKQLCNKFERS